MKLKFSTLIKTCETYVHIFGTLFTSFQFALRFMSRATLSKGWFGHAPRWKLCGVQWLNLSYYECIFNFVDPSPNS